MKKKIICPECSAKIHITHDPEGAYYVCEQCGFFKQAETQKVNRASENKEGMLELPQVELRALSTERGDTWK